MSSEDNQQWGELILIQQEQLNLLSQLVADPKKNQRKTG